MKRCPDCGREYDSSMMFCLDDGTELLYGPTSADEPATEVLPAGTSGSEAATRAQIHATGAAPQGSFENASERRSLSAHWVAKPLVAVAVATALLIGGFFIYRYFSMTKQIHSIAVMPFSNESGNADVDYLSDGMTETLINTLTQLPDLKVKP